MTDAGQHETASTEKDAGSRQQPATTSNTVSANQVNTVVQAGMITGGVHNHPPVPRPPVPTPHQLLATPAGFVGRGDQLAALDRALTTPDGASPGDGRQSGGATAVISAIGGTGGIGKTWLALAWANRNLHRFPDGHLLVDLRGFSPGEPRHPTDVLADFLAALGVDRDHQPTELDARIALYRTHTTGKHLLILLDNAATTDQIEPLLPGGTTCTVLITSRHGLNALTARHGARPVRLDVLTDGEARTLLHATLGHPNASADIDRAITDLIGLCKGFPLALGLIAARIRTNPDLIDDLVVDLRDLGLSALDSDDPTASLPTVLSWSLRQLTDDQRTVFGLLGVAPGPDATLPSAASLADMPQDGARRALSALEQASPLERRQGGRYAMHDLVRDYAAAIARDLPDDVRGTALQRVLDFYLHTAYAADRLLNPHRTVVRLGPPAPGARPLPLPDAMTALTWLEAEHAALLASHRAAVTLDRHRLVWDLASALDTYHRRRGHQHDAAAAWQAALEAAAHLPDPVTRITAHRMLGYTWSRLGLHDEATRHLDQALHLAMHHQDPTQQAHTHVTLAIAWAEWGDDRRALEHARRALDLCRTLAEPVWEAGALSAVGRYAARLGEFDIARNHCHAALALIQQHPDPDGEADTLDSLGFIAYRTGDHRQAIERYHQATTLYGPLGNSYAVADTLDHSGHPHVALDQHDQARTVWREALELYQEQGRSADVERVQQQLDHLDNLSSDTERSLDDH